MVPPPHTRSVVDWNAVKHRMPVIRSDRKLLDIFRTEDVTLLTCTGRAPGWNSGRNTRRPEWVSLCTSSEAVIAPHIRLRLLLATNQLYAEELFSAN